MQLDIAADVLNLATVRRFIESAATAWGADAQATGDLIQAADEAATNIIVHGYRGQPGTLQIEVARSGPLLLVYLRDRSPAFDPCGFTVPDVSLPLEARRPGGLGIYLMRQFTDEMTYRLLPDGHNELRLAKRAFL